MGQPGGSNEQADSKKRSLAGQCVVIAHHSCQIPLPEDVTAVNSLDQLGLAVPSHNVIAETKMDFRLHLPQTQTAHIKPSFSHLLQPNLLSLKTRKSLPNAMLHFKAFSIANGLWQ